MRLQQPQRPARVGLAAQPGRDVRHLGGIAAILVTLAAVVWATAVVAVPSVSAGTSVCSPRERAGELAGAQGQVLDTLLHGTPGDLTTVENEADLAALAAIGYSVYDHQQTSVRGMGWPVVDAIGGDPTTAHPTPGRPTVLLYAPSGENVTEPRDGFDFPYRLAGWAYAFPYRTGSAPDLLRCVEDDEWFVHEAGVHTFDDGDFDPVRPGDDEPRGAAADDPDTDVDETNPCPEFVCLDRNPGDYGHGRLWDLHLWRGADVPTVSMTNPGPKLPGVDPQIGKAFFYPVSTG